MNTFQTFILQIVLVFILLLTWIPFVSADIEEIERIRSQTQKEIDERIREARERIARVQEEARKSVEESLKRSQENFPDLNLDYEKRMQQHEEYMRNLRERLDKERETGRGDDWREEAQKRIQELKDRAKRDGFDPDSNFFIQRK